MLGMVGSLLGSVASGAMSLFGQQSTNDMMMEMAANRYQTSVKDMMKAGLNPAMMFGSGGPAPMPGIQNPMAGAAETMKTAVSSAVQMKIADKTIDQLTEQIAKMKAEQANIDAQTPGIAARSALDVMRTEAVKKIPPVVRIPLIQAGFGADTMKATGQIGAIGGGAAASAKSVGSTALDAAKDIPVPTLSLSGPTYATAKELAREFRKKGPELWRLIKKHYWDTPPLVDPARETIVYKR